MNLLSTQCVQNQKTWRDVERELRDEKEFDLAPESSRRTWYIDYLKSLNDDEDAKRALAENEKLDKKQRMEEAMEKRKREAEEQRGKLGRELDSERRKHQAGTSR